jgi:aminoglycoside 3-N-acetyltransferase
MSQPGTATFESLVEQFTALAPPVGRPVLVHASMRQVGPVDGGVATVLAALRQVIGVDAAIVVPAQTPNNSTTSRAFQAATRRLAPAEVTRYIARMQGFDPATTPSFGMGVLAEHVRRDSASVRSAHPQTSFAAIGPDAAALMRTHALECHLGEESPLGALYAADASVLLLGVGYAACTAFHLAEYRTRRQPERPYRCFVRDGGERRMREFVGLDHDDGDFDALGAALERGARGVVRAGPVGRGQARLLAMRRSVDFAVAWMDRHR